MGQRPAVLLAMQLHSQEQGRTRRDDEEKASTKEAAKCCVMEEKAYKSP
jgi:hypothetical protein